ncbi:MAG: hypothetical protein HS120_05555 [Burkholderiales bacterium]|nr:hypothetical protein [Burkholderiales bacterium]
MPQRSIPETAKFIIDTAILGVNCSCKPDNAPRFRVFHCWCSLANIRPKRFILGISPVDALKSWQVKKPDLFKKRVYKQAGLGRHVIPAGRQRQRALDDIATMNDGAKKWMEQIGFLVTRGASG